MRRLAVIVMFATTAAHADPSDMIARPLVLDRGQLAAAIVVETSIAPNEITKPTTLAPDVWVGVLPRLTLGLVHSNQTIDRIEPGASFCVVREDIRCERRYHGSGIDVMWSARPGRLAVAPRARFLLRDVSPIKPAVTVGALLRWTAGRFAITGDPYLQLGLYNLDRGNRAAIFVPITFALQPTCKWLLAFETGWNSDLEVIRDGWHIPIGFGVRARATDHLDLGGELGFTSLLGPQNTPKDRIIVVSAGWRT